MSSSVDFEEIECKFLGVDVAALKHKLDQLKAELQFSRVFRRTVFDYPDLRLNKDNSWLRVRDEGDRTTISFKQRFGVSGQGNDAGIREIEIVADDFDQANNLFHAIGMKPKFYEENRRTQYLFDGVEICIDEWPLIPPYVEIEGQSWEAVLATAERLGFDPEKRVIYSTMQVYANYGIDESSYQILTFDKQVKK